jgi:hypothetical protein
MLDSHPYHALEDGDGVLWDELFESNEEACLDRNATRNGRAPGAMLLVVAGYTD